MTNTPKYQKNQIIRNFKPANDKQRRFLYSTKQYLMLSGAVAAGKSLMGCYKGFMLNMKYPGNKGLICRKEARSLSGSTIQTLLQQVIPPELIVDYNQSRGILIHRTPDPEINSTIVFSGLDKKADQSYPTKVGSTEYGWIFADEGIEFNEGDWHMLSTRLRYKLTHLSDKENSKIPRQMFTATNPDSPYHWLYQFFFDNQHDDREVFLTTPYDNPYLPEDYLKKLEGSLSGISRDRLLHGKWVIAEGVIYDTFDPKVHVTDEGFLKIEDYKELILGADSNYPLPRAGVIIGKRPDGVDIIDEFYQENAHVEHLIDWLKQYTDERFITAYHDPSDPTAIDKLNSSKNLSCKKADNTVIGGISEVSRYFSNNLIRIHPRCKNLLKELHSYRWESDKRGEKPRKENDHLCDALRYGLMGIKQNSGTFALLEDNEGVFF